MPIKRKLKIGNQEYEQTLPEPGYGGRDLVYGQEGWHAPQPPKWSIPEKGSVEERCIRAIGRHKGRYHDGEQGLKKDLQEAIAKYPPEWIEEVCKWVEFKHKRREFIGLKSLLTALNNEDWRERWSQEKGKPFDEWS
jgi:hypothetical protein